MSESLRVLYLMEDTDLSGGVRVQLAHADALIARGHHVSIATKGLPLRWRRSSADWIYVEDFRTVDTSTFDFVVATFWTTIQPAWEIAGDRVVHLCQGFEGSFTAYEAQREEIEQAYSRPLPRWTVAPHLNDSLARFGSDVTWIGQVVDDEFYRRGRAEASDPPRVLLAGASQIDFKGIDVGYGAVQHARWNGASFDLVRVSPWAPAPDEPRELAVEFHVGLDAPSMAQLVHSCDYFIGPSRRDEGFGLPAAEAMAAGLPAVLSRIPSFLSFAEGSDYAAFADEDDPVGMGDALAELLDNEELAKKLSIRGRQISEQWRAHNVAERIENWARGRRR